MKVLSLTEPFATLIKEKKKQIETRSWKTNYRGPLYIHASMTKVAKKNLEDKNLMALVEDKMMNFGYIICKCDLVDCIYMTEEYVDEIRKNHKQEYICGGYSVGRYAWILKNVEVLEQPIKAKGSLNIWDYYNEFEIMDLMNTIEYGFIDENQNFYQNIDSENFNRYILKSPNEVITEKIGLCWDQVELERYYFQRNDWDIKTYYIAYYDDDMCPTHTFLTFKKEDKYYWFEHSWERFRGIHEYESLQGLLFDVENKFIHYELNHRYDKSKLVLHEYQKSKPHISVQEMYDHFRNYQSD